MSWDRKDILEYAVGEREDELLKWEIQNSREGIDGNVYDKVRGIVSLAIIKDGIELSDLGGIREDLETELNLAGISLKDFLINIQLLEGDGIIRAHMPDILAEYYVLRTLVIEANSNSGVVRWVISRLVNNMEGVPEFREKVRQDFRYTYDGTVIKDLSVADKLRAFYITFFNECSRDTALSIVNRLIANVDLRDTNAIILHEAICNLVRHKRDVDTITEELLHITYVDDYTIEEQRNCLEELRYLSGVSNDNLITYCKGLLNMVNHASTQEEKNMYLMELRHLAEINNGEAEIAIWYCKGNFNMFNNASTVEEKETWLDELKHYSDKYDGNEDIAFVYSQGLCIFLLKVTSLEEKRSYYNKLRYLFDKYIENVEIMIEYCKGLVNMIDGVPVEEKREFFEELKRYAEAYSGNAKMQIVYSAGIFNMLNYAQSTNEKREYLADLGRLAEANEGNAEIALRYCNGLVNMTYDSNVKENPDRLGGTILVNMTSDPPDIDEKKEYLEELMRYAADYADNDKIVLDYTMALVNILIFVPKEEKRVLLSQLRHLAMEYAYNIEIIGEYCIGLYNMCVLDVEYYDDYLSELCKLLSYNKISKYISKIRPNIITYTRRELLDYERRNGTVRVSG